MTYFTVVAIFGFFSATMVSPWHPHPHPCVALECMFGHKRDFFQKLPPSPSGQGLGKKFQGKMFRVGREREEERVKDTSSLHEE